MAGIIMPQHVAAIMDGNGRWAKKRFMPRVAGHKKGLETARLLVQQCLQKKIQALTLFAFGTDNWKRPTDEVSALFKLFLGVLEGEAISFHEQGVRLRVLGDKQALPAALRDSILHAEGLTRHNKRLFLNVALNYSGRWDIVQATKRVSSRVQAGEIQLSEIDEAVFDAETTLYGQPPVDLLIRTSGEIRLSNFLLWDLVYAELYFSDLLWPDFREEAFDAALADFARRERRFGYTGEQLEALEDA